MFLWMDIPFEQLIWSLLNLSISSSAIIPWDVSVPGPSLIEYSIELITMELLSIKYKFTTTIYYEDIHGFAMECPSDDAMD